MKNYYPKSFDALFVKKNDSNQYNLVFGKSTINKINNDDLIIKVFYSSINYKDILVCNGNPGLVRKYPHIPGIDAAGEIVYSKSRNFKKGDKVIIAAQPTGIQFFGGFSEYLKVSDKYVEKLPAGLSLKKSMIFGTAGFTAMLAVSALIENGLKKNGKPILISGATGGVGSIAILILSKLGYSVSALTSKSNQKTYLKKIGAEEVISIKSFSNYPDMPLLKTKFSSIIDNIGGNVISIGSRQLENNGNIASVGIASSETSNINIMPLILRGIKIVGINAENTPYLIRKKIWKKISALSKDNRLNYIYNECKFKDITKKIRKIGLNKNFGRTIIKIKK